jgi:hypothetical protein
LSKDDNIAEAHRFTSGTSHGGASRILPFATSGDGGPGAARETSLPSPKRTLDGHPTSARLKQFLRKHIQQFLLSVPLAFPGRLAGHLRKRRHAGNQHTSEPIAGAGARPAPPRRRRRRHPVPLWVLGSDVPRHASGRNSALAPIAQYGFLGVPVFFAISGCVIAYSAEGRTAVCFACHWCIRPRVCRLAFLRTMGPPLDPDQADRFCRKGRFLGRCHTGQAHRSTASSVATFAEYDLGNR